MRVCVCVCVCVRVLVADGSVGVCGCADECGLGKWSRTQVKWRRPLDDVRVAWGGRARRHRVVVDVVMAKNIRLIITRW